MALDRTWFNTLIDDNGTNTVGTVWNKGSVDSLMDATDKEFIDARMEVGPAIYLQIVGNVDNWAGNPGYTVWEVFPQPGSSISGIQAPTTGRSGTQHLFFNIGHPILFAHANAQSVAANQMMCPGYANYTLPGWQGIWMYYSSILLKWVLVKP